MFEISTEIFRATDVSFDLLLPAPYPIPPVFTILLGAVHRLRHPVVTGALAFAFHQIGPWLYRGVTRGSSDFFF